MAKKLSEKTLEGIKTVNSMGFNEEKTKELLEEMKEAGIDVSLENLAEYLKQQGLIVKVHVGGGKNDYELSPKVYGINSDSLGEEVKELFDEHMKKSKISFLPHTYAKKLKKLESALRMQCRRSAIGYDNSFMALPTYKDFRDYYKKTQEEYLAVRDDIMDKYDVLVQRFKEITYTSLQKMGAIDLEQEYLAITGRFGTPGTSQYEQFKQRYKDSFYMSLSVKAFPVTENLDMFEDDIREQIQEGLNKETVQTLYEILGNALSDAFSSVGKVLFSSNKNGGTIAPKSMTAVKESIARIGQKNIFANPKIEEVKQDIIHMAAMTDHEAIYEEAEKILSKIYAYSLELNIASAINLSDSPMDEELLLEIAELLEAEKQAEAHPVDEGYLIPDEEALFG